MTADHRFRLVGGLFLVGLVSCAVSNPQTAGRGADPAPGGGTEPIAIDQSRCTAARLGTTIPVSAIGEPVSAVTLSAPRWVEATETVPAHCVVDGAMAGVTEGAPPINFRVALPSTWTRRAAQMGGGGMNGIIPNLTGTGGGSGPTLLARGFMVFGSDSGHQAGGFGPPGGFPGPGGAPGAPPGGPPSAGGPPAPAGAPGPAAGAAAAPAASPNAWALNDEAIQNLGYMQMKKTLDAARILAERMYGALPTYTYYIGGSQGGREGLTVAQRYPDDYDGVVATVPIVNFSTLMLAPELIRIQEKPLAKWVPPTKVNAIRGEFMRQCDEFDGLIDGLINNYMACRAVFDVTQAPPGQDPWAAKRCPGDVDSNPEDTTEAACLTSGQIETLQFIYSPYQFATPLANGVTSFGMWVPTMDPGGSGLLVPTRYRGQEGAAPDAPVHSHLGILGVTGFLMQDLSANPLDYVEGGPLNARRVLISNWLDATNPDLTPFQQSGGKLIVVIGTDDSLASTGAQLDYFQSVIDRMGRSAVDSFARFYVLPQTGHGLSGNYYRTDGRGRDVEVRPIPNQIDRLSLIMRWVEEGIAPGMSEVVTSASGSMPLCSYPTYPRYVGGAANVADSYACVEP